MKGSIKLTIKPLVWDSIEMHEVKIESIKDLLIYRQKQPHTQTCSSQWIKQSCMKRLLLTVHQNITHTLPSYHVFNPLNNLSVSPITYLQILLLRIISC